MPINRNINTPIETFKRIDSKSGQKAYKLIGFHCRNAIPTFKRSTN